MKRVLDLCITSIILILVSPVMLITALLIFVKLGRPVFFKQKRPGLNEYPFYIYKFRTMTNERDVKGNLLPNHKRLTKLGALIRKLSLDELPQLLNVLKGELSLVGPRPLLMEYLELYTAEQARRHKVKPGITGWAQVNGRNSITWEDKFKLDVWYVDNQSLYLDIKILFKTLLKVIKSEGINSNDKVTMDRFRGSVKRKTYE